MKILHRVSLALLLLAPSEANCATAPPLTPGGAAGLGAVAAIAAGAALLADKKSVAIATTDTTAQGQAGGSAQSPRFIGHLEISPNGGGESGTSHDGGNENGGSGIFGSFVEAVFVTFTSGVAIICSTTTSTGTSASSTGTSP
jgi:hypothetical protein